MTATEAAADRLYALLPEYVRSADAGQGRALLAFLRALATGAVALDTEIDRLLASLFVETADDVGLDNIARLIGAELLAPLPGGASFSRRAFIANTIRYRRAKGTVRALEGLAADVGGTGALVVEYFKHLARTVALIDPRPERPGTASLVDGDTGAQIGTGLDLQPRLNDVRSIARLGGRPGVADIGVHVVRLVAPEFPAPPGDTVTAEALAGVPVLIPWRDGAGLGVAGYWQLSPFLYGRAPLLNPDRRDDSDPARSAGAKRIDRLRRLPLRRETEKRREALARSAPPEPGDWFDSDGRPFTLFVRQKNEKAFRRVPADRLLIAKLEVMPAGTPRPAATKAYDWAEPGATAPQIKHGKWPLAAAVDPATGRVVIAKPVSSSKEIVEVRLAHAVGLGDTIGAGAHDRSAPDVPADVDDADFLRVVDWTKPVADPYVASLADALDAWANEKAATRGFIVLARCDAERIASRFTATMRRGTELHVVAADWRPKQAPAGVEDLTTRRGHIARSGRRFVLEAQLRVRVPSPGIAAPGVLVLDGLALAAGLVVGPKALTELRLRHVCARANAKPALSLEQVAAGMTIAIERSQISGIALAPGGAAGQGQLALSRCIVAGTVDAPGFDATIDDTTVLGPSAFKSLEASGVVFAGPLTVTRRQSGCVRYSYVSSASTTPRRFRCQPELAIAERARTLGVDALPEPLAAAIRLAVTPLFIDTDPDEPTFALLSPQCAAEIRTGGHGGKEMGAFAATGEPMRLANIASLFDDYLPAALEGAVLDDTRGQAATARRSMP